MASQRLPFSPQYPLWSDGAEKSRWVALPPESRLRLVPGVDAASALAQWELPVGTRLWKEFREPDGSGSAVGGRRLETRFIWRATARDWVYATYIWNEEQTDAVLAPADGKRLDVVLGDGVKHVVPGATDCLACHDAGRGPVLGFTPLQLADERDPLAPHAEMTRPEHLTVSALVERGLIDEPTQAPEIDGRTPTERAALGYLASNCGPCHNAAGPLAGLGLDLADPSRAVGSTVDVAGVYRVPGQPVEQSRRVHPGDSMASALVHRMRSLQPTSRMPPLGTLRRDETALTLIERWVRDELPVLPADKRSIPQDGLRPTSRDDEQQPYERELSEVLFHAVFGL